MARVLWDVELCVMLRVMCYVHAGHDSPEIEGSDETDSRLQSSDSQDDSENDTQLDCSKIVVVLWYCFRRSRRKRYSTIGGNSFKC